MFGPPSMLRAPGMFTGRAAESTGVESAWCLGFDGVNDTVDCGTPAVMSSSSAFTISLWSYQNTTASVAAGIVRYGSNSSGFTWETWTGNACYMELARNSIYGYTTSWPTYAPANQWNHLCLVYDGSLTGNANRLKCYVNGSQIPLSFIGTIPSSVGNYASFGPLEFGRYQTGFCWNGRIDDPRIYNRALTPTEVTALYENTSPPTSGLVMYMPLEEGLGTTTAIKDGTGATIGTATLTNGPTWSNQVPPALAP